MSGEESEDWPMVTSRSKGSLRLNKEASDKWTQKFSKAEEELQRRQQQQRQRQAASGGSASAG